MPSHQAVTLFELQEHIRRVLALNLPEALWIEAEIAQVNLVRGHCFLSLVQKQADSAEPQAAAEAAIWQNQLAVIRQKLGQATLNDLLHEGIQLRFSARVEYHERYGLKLIIEDIDPSYTYGLLELQRREILERLRREGCLERNSRLPLSPVLQRIALVASEQAAGLQDFVQHLAQNPYGYRFHWKLFPALVQGQQAEAEITRRLAQIAQQAAHFDCVILLRGGGSRLDLSAFDSYAIAKAVAEHPLPVLTGIGHETDESLTDLCAHTSLKTPTAVAEFLIHRHLHFENELLALTRAFQAEAHQMTYQQHTAVQQWQQLARSQCRHILQQQTYTLAATHSQAKQLLKTTLQRHAQSLDAWNNLSIQLHPHTTLQRGFTLTTKDGQAVTKSRQLLPNDLLHTCFQDGLAVSRVIEVKPEEI